MANFTTSADLIEEALRRAGEPVDSTSDFYESAISYLNRCYQSIWHGGQDLDPEINEVWWWIRKASLGVFNLQGARSEGTVEVTKDSATVTFSSAPSDDKDGWYFRVDGHEDVFRISAHTAAAASATLDGAYTGADDSAASYTLFKLEYTLASDLLYLLGPLNVYRAGHREINYVAENEFQKLYPLTQVGPDVPNAFTMIGETTIRVNGYTSDTEADRYRVDYPYAAEPSDLADDTAEPLVPRSYRQILADWVTGLILADKDDDRATTYLSQAQSGLKAMAKEHRKRMLKSGRSFAATFPRKGMRRSIGPLRTQSGLIIG